MALKPSLENSRAQSYSLTYNEEILEPNLVPTFKMTKCATKLNLIFINLPKSRSYGSSMYTLSTGRTKSFKKLRHLQTTVLKGFQGLSQFIMFSQSSD